MLKLSNIPHFEDWMNQIKTAEFCPTCRNWYFAPDEREFIRNVGECPACDHVRNNKEEL